jgi:fatty acid desaturase
MHVSLDTRRRALARRSGRRLIVSFVLALGPVGLVVLVPALRAPWVIVPLWLVQALGMVGISNAAHEVVHGHMFFRRRLDLWTGRCLHGLLLLNHDVHRRYHLAHHAHTGTERDSEGIFDFDSLASLHGYLTRLLRWTLPPSPLHVLNWSEGVGAAVGRERYLGRGLTRGRAAGGLIVPVLVVAGIVVWLVVDPIDALLMAVLPELVIFSIITFVMSLPEHFGLAARDYSDRTRNVLSWAPVQYVLWNFNLHAVHHRNPQLHFSELPDRIDPASPTAGGYLSFHVDVVGELIRPASLAPEQLGMRP